MIDESLYEGREQTLVKHFVLDAYLEKFAHVIGSWASTITYVDCFSGPWRALSQDYRDTSFGIAIRELRRARKTYAARGRTIQMRCFFVEEDEAAYTHLKRFVATINDIEIETRNSNLESAIEDVTRFVSAGGRDSFMFAFIDPTGWTGFAMEVIAPLLRVRPGEVLVNFMTAYIRRFVNVEATAAEFIRMFGSDISGRVRNLEPEEREDALVQEYATKLARTGGFLHVASAIVFKPEIESTYFHLVYGTRNDKGLEVFKQVEEKMQPVMAKARGTAKLRKAEARSGQVALPLMAAALRSSRYESLRARYTARSRVAVQLALEKRREVPYDDLWRLALSSPLVWERDLRQWLAQWQRERLATLNGLAPRERVPKREAGHVVRWLKSSN